MFTFEQNKQQTAGGGVSTPSSHTVSISVETKFVLIWEPAYRTMCTQTHYFLILYFILSYSTPCLFTLSLVLVVTCLMINL